MAKLETIIKYIVLEEEGQDILWVLKETVRKYMAREGRQDKVMVQTNPEIFKLLSERIASCENPEFLLGSSTICEVDGVLTVIFPMLDSNDSRMLVSKFEVGPVQHVKETLAVRIPPSYYSKTLAVEPKEPDHMSKSKFKQAILANMTGAKNPQAAVEEYCYREALKLDELSALRELMSAAIEVGRVLAVPPTTKVRYSERELLEQYAAGVREFPNIHLADCDLSGALLPGIQMPGALITNTCLNGATLSNANLVFATIKGSSLCGVSLSQAQLKCARISHSNFSIAHMPEASLQLAKLDDVLLEGAFLHRSKLSGAHIENSNLSGADLSKADLERMSLLASVLNHTNFSGTLLESIYPPPAQSKPTGHSPKDVVEKGQDTPSQKLVAAQLLADARRINTYKDLAIWRYKLRAWEASKEHNEELDRLSVELAATEQHLCWRYPPTQGEMGTIHANVVAKKQPQNEGTVVLPDGSAVTTATMPLPKDHWLFQSNKVVPPVPFRTPGTRGNPDKETIANKVRDAARYAIRCATMSGKEKDWDPDALVQNIVVAMLGTWTDSGFSDLEPDKPAELPTTQERMKRLFMEDPVKNFRKLPDGSYLLQLIATTASAWKEWDLFKVLQAEPGSQAAVGSYGICKKTKQKLNSQGQVLARIVNGTACWLPAEPAPPDTPVAQYGLLNETELSEPDAYSSIIRSFVTLPDGSYLLQLIATSSRYECDLFKVLQAEPGSQAAVGSYGILPRTHLKPYSDVQARARIVNGKAHWIPADESP